MFGMGNAVEQKALLQDSGKIVETERELPGSQCEKRKVNLGLGRSWRIKTWKVMFELNVLDSHVYRETHLYILRKSEVALEPTRISTVPFFTGDRFGALNL